MARKNLAGICASTIPTARGVTRAQQTTAGTVSAGRDLAERSDFSQACAMHVSRRAIPSLRCYITQITRTMDAFSPRVVTDVSITPRELGVMLRNHRLTPYAIAIVTVIVAATVRTTLAPLFSEKFVLITFYPAVMVMAWLGGFWPGAVATALAAAVADYLWLEPLRSFRIASAGDVVALGLFVSIGVVISVLNENLRQGRARERTARTSAERAEHRAVEAFEAEATARAEAERANHLKDYFLASVSHELRAPLNAILGWSDMLRRGILDEHGQQRARDAIHANAERQQKLIEDLIDVARIVSGKLRLDRGSVDLLSVVRGALEVVQPAGDAKRISISTEFDPGIPSVSGDAARLQQVLWNLLTNAIKFTPDGGAVRLSTRRALDAVEIVVSDTGKGIAREFLPFVFDAFRQAEKGASAHVGIGLGLSIVKQLVIAHGGTIEVASRGEGQGSTFTVRLPIGADPAGARSDSVQPENRDPGVVDLHAITILAVDHDPTA